MFDYVKKNKQFDYGGYSWIVVSKRLDNCRCSIIRNGQWNKKGDIKWNTAAVNHLILKKENEKWT